MKFFLSIFRSQKEKMKGKLIGILSLGLVLFSGKYPAQNQSQENQKMEWFQDAKLGIFIHW